MQNSFNEEFASVVAPIQNPAQYIYHARAICAHEQNYFALFAIDKVLEHRQNKYRKDNITWDPNHQADIFFQLHNFHEQDKKNKNDFLYLPDNPLHDKTLAWLHDEGEDTDGLTEAQLELELTNFLNQISGYVEQHNSDYPDLILPQPSEEEIATLDLQIPDLVEPFHIITKNYKGEANTRDYYEYHKNLLGPHSLDKRAHQWHARACRVKMVDKSVNASTFPMRSQEMLSKKNREKAVRRYRAWAMGQINKMRDIYCDQDFLSSTLSHKFNALTDCGFAMAAATKFPESREMINMMYNVIRLQLKMYNHNLANETGSQGSPKPNISLPEYQDIVLTPALNLLSVTESRLEETQRIDKLGDKRQQNQGMFDIPFHSTAPNKIKIPLSTLSL